jgi:hypothetical protein
MGGRERGSHPAEEATELVMPAFNLSGPGLVVPEVAGFELQPVVN